VTKKYRVEPLFFLAFHWRSPYTGCSSEARRHEAPQTKRGAVMADKKNGNGKLVGKPQSSGGVKETKMAEGTATAVAEPVAAEPKEVLVEASDARIVEALKPLIGQHIKATVDEVSAEQKGKEEKAKREYVRLTALTVEGALALCGGRMDKVGAKDENGKDIAPELRGNGVLDYFNYGYDLGVRSTERNELLRSLEGPEKGIERAVKGLVAAGIDRTVAIGITVTQLKAQGAIPADYTYNG
jgi:hypothetical protein